MLPSCRTTCGILLVVLLVSSPAFGQYFPVEPDSRRANDEIAAEREMR